jgi:hypothetical protein
MSRSNSPQGFINESKSHFTFLKRKVNTFFKIFYLLQYLRRKRLDSGLI